PSRRAADGRGYGVQLPGFVRLGRGREDERGRFRRPAEDLTPDEDREEAEEGEAQAPLEGSAELSVIYEDHHHDGGHGDEGRVGERKGDDAVADRTSPPSSRTCIVARTATTAAGRSVAIGNSVPHSGSGRRDRRRRYTSQASAARTAAIKNSSTGQPAAAGHTVVKAPESAAVAFVWVPTCSRAAWIALGHPTRRTISRVIPRARARTAHQEKAFGGRFTPLRFRRRRSTLP